ncbi:MAG: hypothetical protein ACUVWR_11475 [Anaerolineae bacterium]
MNDTLIVTVYVITDDVLKASGHKDHVLAEVSDAEVLTIAVVASMYCHNHHERALFVLKGQYLPLQPPPASPRRLAGEHPHHHR